MPGEGQGASVPNAAGEIKVSTAVATSRLRRMVPLGGEHSLTAPVRRPPPRGEMPISCCVESLRGIDSVGESVMTEQRFRRFQLPRWTFPAIAVVVLVALVNAAARDPVAVRRRAQAASTETSRSAGATLSTDATVVAIDRLLAESRLAAGVEAAAAADNLTILRRLWLAACRNDPVARGDPPV